MFSPGPHLTGQFITKVETAPVGLAPTGQAELGPPQLLHHTYYLDT